MALDRTPNRRDGTLSPTRWARPGAGSIIRWMLVAALLALALGALYLREPTSSCPTPSAGVSGSNADPAGSDGPVGGTGSTGPAGTSPAVGSGPAGRPNGSPAGPGGSAAPGNSGVPVPAGTVGVPIRLAEPAALTVARPGARVDLLAAPGGDQAGRAPKPIVLATRVLVLDVLGPGQTDGAVSAIYLALRPDQAHRAVGMPESTRFAIIVRS
ncbi:flagellar biosynthesis protein FlgA [Plantactinospora sp. KLBMP9567]|uniref:flagellar biosynthesis protein FlgA n=1 Tax=Plantactinospora sp. KLBMP9567 TaxID=3085900 RepID=UPI0029812ED5|nr:flagellar biosynthesis protein FlgA [Plantactinospora sp. KLBMP9567]MDW5328780.1 flagellar biosynthesis protein FlgA [Plantactinospora sp. KLBMP9567]